MSESSVTSWRSAYVDFSSSSYLLAYLSLNPELEPALKSFAIELWGYLYRRTIESDIDEIC